MNDRLTYFLYLLIRDNLPPGEVSKLVDKAEGTDRGWTSFGNDSELEALARKWAERLAGRG